MKERHGTTGGGGRKVLEVLLRGGRGKSGRVMVQRGGMGAGANQEEIPP